MKNKNQKISYAVFMWVGVCFMGLGVVFMFAVNTVMGLALLAVGIGNYFIGFSARSSRRRREKKSTE